MHAQFSLRNLAAICARYPGRVVGTWSIVFLLAVIFAGTSLAGVLGNEFKLTTDFNSVVGSRELANSSLADSTGITETIILRSLDGTTIDGPSFRTHAGNIVNAVRTEQGRWNNEQPTTPPDLLSLANNALEGSYVLSYFEIQDAFGNPQVRAMADSMGATEQIEGLVSDDGDTLLIPVVIGSEQFDIASYIDVVNQFDTDRFEVTTIGNYSINEIYQQVVAEELVTAESIGVPIAIAVLLLVFGSLVAPIVPLVLGIMSVGIALGIVTIIGQFSDLQLFVQNMVTMLGLAVGIDYSLFMVERFREQRARGQSKQRAIEIAGATSGKAVVFSGLTLILAMSGVMLVRINIFYSLAVGAIVVVAVAVILSATLVPALLSLVGDQIDWPRRKRQQVVETNESNMYQGFWGKVTKIVVDRPWISLVSAVLILLILASPVLHMKTGFSRSGQLPPGESTEAYKVLENDFSAGLLSPVYVVFVGQRSDEVDQAVEFYRSLMVESGDFVSVSEPKWDDVQRVAEIEATLAFEGSSERAYDVIEVLRDDFGTYTINNVEGLSIYVTGQSAGESDMVHHLKEWTPRVFAFVLGLSFILLLLAFRSVVVPLQAIVFNVLSVGAAWGIMVGVFSDGVGRDFLGYNSSDIVEMWLPILMFCVLFGLSMDYHVFIVSRIREHYDISHNNHESVAVGLRSTGKIITGAAAIMVVVFGAFSMGSMLAIQQLGFGLAVAVAIDATIVRSVLVPSVMTLVGDKNWYLPGWLNWLPDLRIESDTDELS